MAVEIGTGEHIAAAQQAVRSGDWPEALRRWQTVQTIAPTYAPAYLGAGNALREAGRLEDAEQAFSAGLARFPDHEALAFAWATLATLRRDWPAAIERWSAVRTRFPLHPQVYLGSIHAIRGAGQFQLLEPLAADAEAALAASKQNASDTATALRLELEIAKMRLDWQAVRLATEQLIARETQPSAQLWLSLAQACLRDRPEDRPEEHKEAGSFDHLEARSEVRLTNDNAADHAAQQAIAINNRLTQAWMVRLQIATRRGDGETALACYRALIDIDPGVVRWRLKLAQLLSWLGRVKESLAELEQVQTKWPEDPMVKVFLRSYGSDMDDPGATPGATVDEPGATPGANMAKPAATAGPVGPTTRPIKDRAANDPDFAKEKDLELIASQAPALSDQRRTSLVPDAERDVLIATMPGADTAVLVFTGTNDEVSMPLEIFDRYLSIFPVTAVYLKDFRRLRFLQGITSLGDDLPATLTALRNLLVDLGIKRLSTLGNCVGGFAAIRYGVELDAERVLAFSPPTYSPVETPVQLEEGRRFMKKRLEANIPRDLMDLQSFLSERTYTGRIDLFYEDLDPRDQSNAVRLAGLPGVHLQPQAERSYRLLRRLAASRPNFLELLAGSLGVSPRDAY
jgi:tetratricopeptide (TPR) repeat protein